MAEAAAVVAAAVARQEAETAAAELKAQAEREKAAAKKAAIDKAAAAAAKSAGGAAVATAAVMAKVTPQSFAEEAGMTEADVVYLIECGLIPSARVLGSKLRVVQASVHTGCRTNPN